MAGAVGGAQRSFAVVEGRALEAAPEDLYVPPDALRIFLEAFEGPLDLLLYLIRRQNLDILSLPVARVAEQYMRYIGVMQEMKIGLAAEYLLMAATLAEIKSRTLLPRPPDADAEEEDPRAELVRRLLEYERFRKAARDLDRLPRAARDFHEFETPCAGLKIVKPPPRVALDDLVGAFQEVLRRAEFHRRHAVAREPLPVRERIANILALLGRDGSVAFADCFAPREGSAGVIVTFLALLELIKAGMIRVEQNAAYAPIHLSAA